MNIFRIKAMSELSEMAQSCLMAGNGTMGCACSCTCSCRCLDADMKTGLSSNTSRAEKLTALMDKQAR